MKDAEEVVDQVGPFNVFWTVSIAEKHNAKLLALLGVPSDAPLEVRDATTRAAPVLVDSFLDWWVEPFITYFVDEVLGAEYTIIRTEYQARNAPHKHAVSYTPRLRMPAWSKSYVDGRIAGHEAGRRVADCRSRGVPVPAALSEFEPPLTASLEDAPDEALAAARDLSDADLAERIREGHVARLALERVATIFMSGLNPVVTLPVAPNAAAGGAAADGDAAAQDSAGRTREREEAVAEHKRVAGDLDVITYVMDNKATLPFERRVELLLNRCMIHACQPNYCHMRGKKRLDKCRFNAPWPVRADTAVNVEFNAKTKKPSVKLEVPLNDPSLPRHCRVMLDVMGSNVDFKLVADQETVMHYMLKYVLKEDVTRAETDRLLRAVSGQNVAAEISPAANRVAERLRSGQIDTCVQLLTSVAGLTSSSREIGAPEMGRYLLGQPFVEFRHLNFANVPSTIWGHSVNLRAGDDEAAGDGGGDEEPVLRSNAWSCFGKRVALLADPDHLGLQNFVAGFPSRDDGTEALRSMNADRFYDRFYVSKGRVLTQRPRPGSAGRTTARRTKPTPAAPTTSSRQVVPGQVLPVARGRFDRDAAQHRVRRQQHPRRGAPRASRHARRSARHRHARAPGRLQLHGRDQQGRAQVVRCRVPLPDLLPRADEGALQHAHHAAQRAHRGRGRRARGGAERRRRRRRGRRRCAQPRRPRRRGGRPRVRRQRGAG